MATNDSLTIDQIRTAPSDKALFALLSTELERRLPDRSDLDSFVQELQHLPRGLRAMAATYDLDVSMALDDLGWHFGNWHHKPLARETIAGLKELGAVRAAEIFEEAFRMAEHYWSQLGSESWHVWYSDSDPDKALHSLNIEMWSICNRSSDWGLMSYWLEYARRYPERLVG
ncbi:MAG: hypothetical protein JSV78_08995 [Phycisphaerales bacterium]|nr:MAG: hypothetical protein JSV78_08995 [Phycisphaerales bacterium]